MDKSKKPTIGLIPNERGWAFETIANQVKKHLDGRFNMKVLFASDYSCFAEVVIAMQDCDIIHSLLYNFFNILNLGENRRFLQEKGFSVENFIEKYCSNKIITSAVYNHMEWNDRAIDKCFDLVDNYYVSSEILYNMYNNSPRFPNPDRIITDGVELQKFKPTNIERFNLSKLDRTIKIGWAGNSVSAVGLKDLKGLHTIIKPAILDLQNQGYDIELIYAEKKESYIPHDKMPEFYAGLDIYLCASLHEGTPQPVLEAMACGVPIIATHVGIVPEAFGEEQKKFILEKRTPEHLAEAIKRLISQKELFQILSNENLKQIQNWDWSIISEKFHDFFLNALAMDKERKERVTLPEDFAGQNEIREKVIEIVNKAFMKILTIDNCDNELNLTANEKDFIKFIMLLERTFCKKIPRNLLKKSNFITINSITHIIAIIQGLTC